MPEAGPWKGRALEGAGVIGAAARATGAATLMAAAGLPSICAAGSWVQPRGEGQIIVKYEDMAADQGFDPQGGRIDLPARRRDRSTGVFAEYGVTDRLTLQLKGDWQDGRDAFVDYQGRGPIEVGATWQVWRGDRAAISLYGGYAQAGDGRNAGYAAPGVGDHDVEARVSAGRSFGPVGTGRWRPDRTFAEVQVARRMRDGLPDETRADVTAGAHFGDRWMALAQAYGGMTDGDGARWLSVEMSVVRNLGRWSLQAGWREAAAGRDTPSAAGPVVAIWRRF